MSDEYIKKDDAIKAMAKAVRRILYDAEEISRHVMNSIPTADVVERKRGEWFLTTMVDYGAPVYICSVDIVHCRECKHKEKCDAMIAFGVLGEEIVDVHPISFCSYGEREGE